VVLLDFEGLYFHHLIDLFQKQAPDLFFVAAPGVGDMSLTIKAPRPLPVNDAVEAAAGALDLEVHRAGNVVVFMPRFGPVPEKRPRGEAQVSALPPVRPWPEKFVGADMLVDLVVKDKSLTEVAKLLEDYASAYDFSRGADQLPMTRPYQIAIALPDPIPSRIRVAAAIYRRPLAEVLDFLTRRFDLTYTVDQGPDKTVISLTPKPWVAVPRDPAGDEAADQHRRLDHSPLPGPRTPAQ
jgi:hypothetical protein